jgi:beta-N-acetylhexosaminidase
VTASRLFIVGIGGTAVTPAEREIFRRVPPGGVILFSRNLESSEQVDELIRDLRNEVAEALLFIDQEGGPVDRLSALAGPSPSFSGAAARGEALQAGRRAGELCALFGIDVDLAPVVDRAVAGAGEKILEDRCASEEPGRVIGAARDFLAGLREFGVAGCLKHFPGLGRGSVDSHLQLPRIADGALELEKDLRPFEELREQAGAVMIAHAAVGDSPLPATLDRAIATALLRDQVGFRGVAIGDDLEMGALSAYGTLPARAAAAIKAGCDLVILSREIGTLEDCVRRIGEEVASERLREAEGRRLEFSEGAARLRSAAPTRPRPLAEIQIPNS